MFPKHTTGKLYIKFEVIFFLNIFKLPYSISLEYRDRVVADLLTNTTVGPSPLNAPASLVQQESAPNWLLGKFNTSFNYYII